MIAGKVSRRIVLDRLGFVEQMLERIRALPLENPDAFFSDERNPDALESCLRRALEALLDVGRHILAKGFAIGVTEYKQIAVELHQLGVLTKEEEQILRKMAGYRNRMVHFYHAIHREELYQIANHNLGDFQRILSAYKRWMKEHPQAVQDDW